MRGVSVASSREASHRVAGSRLAACLKALGWLVTVAIALLIVALAFLSISPSYHAYIVRSGSMKPAINMGDLVIAGPAHGFLSRGISPGTIVTYRLGDDLVTHRVQSVDGDRLLTKGDAVEEADPAGVSTSQVVAVFITRIPKAGFFISFLRTKLFLSLLTLLITCAALALVVIKIVKSVHTYRRHEGGLRPGGT
jgi:signal peptidase